MASLLKKFKRKRRLSSELHSRWGDVAISYPTEGSWNQWNQPAGFVANASTQSSSRAPRHILENSDSCARRSRSTSVPDESSRPLSTIPKGHFDEHINCRLRRNRQRVHGLGLSDRRYDVSTAHDSAAVKESCDEEEEEAEDEQDILGEPHTLSPRYHAPGDMRRTSGWDDYETSSDCASKSPPLSVTSRMRHCSYKSCSTEPSSRTMSATTSSRHTSYTAASSVSAPPTLPPETPRFAYQAKHLPVQPEKRVALRAKYREPGPVAEQKLVPSYEELYG